MRRLVLTAAPRWTGKEKRQIMRRHSQQSAECFSVYVMSVSGDLLCYSRSVVCESERRRAVSRGAVDQAA
jgi:hypothetical protein